MTIAGSVKTPDNQRLAALNSLVAIDPAKHVPLLGHILADATQPAGLRTQVSGILARLNRPEALAQLIAALPTAPAPLQTVIAGDLLGSREGTDRLLDAIAAGKASPRSAARAGSGAAHLAQPVPRSRGAGGPVDQGIAAGRSARAGIARQTPHRLPRQQGRPAAGRQGVREELRHLSSAGRQGCADRAAVGRHRQSRAWIGC